MDIPFKFTTQHPNPDRIEVEASTYSIFIKTKNATEVPLAGNNTPVRGQLRILVIGKELLYRWISIQNN